MAIILERHILLSSGTGLGIGTISTTSSTPGETANPTYAYLDTAQYSNATYYFECDFKTSAGTATAGLYDTAGNLVSSSAVNTSSTSPVIVRSGAISPSTNTYTVRLSVTGGNTLTYYSSRIIIIQNANAITATEEQRDLISDSQALTGASYADFSTIYWDFFRFTSANWDNATYYLDVTFKNSAGTGTVGLHTAANALVTNAECATTSTTYTRVRSAAFTLVDGTDYKVRGKSSTGTITITSAKLIVQQALPTKSESHVTLLRSTTAASATGASFQDTLHKITYTSGNWNTGTISWLHECGAHANTASGVVELFNITGAARTTGSNVTTSNNGTMTRYRSGSLTMPSSQDITARASSAAGTVYQSLVHLIAVMTWTNVVPASSKLLLLGVG